MNDSGIESGAGNEPSAGRLCRWKAVAALAGVAIGAAATANALIALRTPMAQNVLSGTFGRYQYRHGALAYTVAGSGSPLLFLHGLGAGNSMAEWSANYEALKQYHTVYAFDFPGWGLSDKPQRLLTPEDCIEPILFFAEDIIGEPCAVVASSDACDFAIEAVARRPELFSKLVLVCPSTREQEVSSGVAAALVQRFFHVPVLGRTIFNVFASRNAIRSFAQRHLYFDKSRVTEKLVTRYYTGAHQPETENGFAAFLSGALNADARPAWGGLAQPALLVWGRNSLINPLETAPEWLALKPDAELEVIDRAMLLPHTEHPEEFNTLVLDWLK